MLYAAFFVSFSTAVICAVSSGVVMDSTVGVGVGTGVGYSFSKFITGRYSVLPDETFSAVSS